MRRVFLVIVVALLVVVGLLLPRSKYWPQERIVIGLPYTEEDPPLYMEPMGETVNHPKPDVPLGHPGIDFKWDHAAEIKASADGRVDKIESIVDHGFSLVTIGVRSGKYRTVYAELGKVADGLKVGSQVKKGEIIGYINPESGQMHWDFGYAIAFEPLCPLTYFDDHSRMVIVSNWEAAGYSLRDRFPDICSGDFADRNE